MKFELMFTLFSFMFILLIGTRFTMKLSIINCQLSITLLLLLMVGGKVFGQSERYSDLYIKIDSIISYELEYVYDSTTDKLPTYKWDSTRIHQSFPTISPNPSPLIFFDGNIVKRSELNNHRLKVIAKIDVYRNYMETVVLYGSQAKNGVVIIQTKKFYKKSQKRKKR